MNSRKYTTITVGVYRSWSSSGTSRSFHQLDMAKGLRLLFLASSFLRKKHKLGHHATFSSPGISIDSPQPSIGKTILAQSLH
jgi:hypothetical protein